MPEQFARKQTGSCTPTDTHIYYTWGEPWTCGPFRGGWDPMVTWQKRYTQTCN
jgi:hypothetical protein